MASDLRPTELFKYDWRVDVFLKKYQNHQPFTTMDHRQVVLMPQQHVVHMVLKRDVKALNQVMLVTDQAQGIKLSQLQKTPEFGGKMKGVISSAPAGEQVHGLLHRMHHLDVSYKLNAPTATERGELMVLQDINQYIAHMESPIDVSIGGKILKNIYGANKVAGTPKADVALVTFHPQKKKFQNVYFLSHKLGTDASGFQQYSGISREADGKMPGAISEHPEVLKFLRMLAQVHGRILDARERFFMSIQDDELIGKAVYGPEFSARNRNTDNVDMIAQGNPILRPQGKVHALSFSAAASSFSTDISHFKTGSYKAILGARFGSGRKFEVDGKSYPDVRVGIMPIKLLGGNAKNLEQLDNAPPR